ncbi:response regulator transcription factor [Myxococcota bacterium]|nr:response regulator transcription factor [Myxococcota bacterium]MBU1536814.1 response regulator transcription factor [Myxococcota bacterium]
MTLRIVLADDHKLFMQGLMTLLEGDPEFVVVGEASNGVEVVEMVKEKTPDVVIMDVDMPELDGIEATRAIIEGGFAAKVVALSMHDSKYHVLHMLEAGALGYILKDTIFEDLVKAVKVVAKGESYLSPKIARVVIREMSRFPETEQRDFSTLTTREQEVLKGIADGKRSKDIGGDLFISEKTVENHRKNIMTKLNIHSIAELTKFAIRNNLTDL